jgi:hypothetical protein
VSRVTERLEGWAVAARAVGVVLIASSVVLGATGVPLIWRYAPPVHSGLRAVHAGAAVLFMCSAIALLCVVLVRRFPARGRPSSGWLAGIAVAVVAVVGIVTGRMIAWDWIGLRAVTVGEDLRGVLRAGSSDQIRFVVIDGTAVAPGTYRFWVIVHLVLLPALCASGALLAARRRRHHVSLRRESALAEQQQALS